MMHSSSSRRLFRLTVAFSLLLTLLGPVAPAAAQRSLSPSAQSAAVSSDSAAPVPTSATAPSQTATPSPVPNGEIVALRTRTSRTYATAQGYQTVLSAASVSYADSSGAWQPIDNTLVASSASGYASQNAANSYTALFPPSLNAAPIKVTKGTQFVAFQLVGASNAALTTNGPTATYAGVLPNVNLSYTALPDSLKEDLTLQNASAPATSTYNVTTSAGLAAQQNSAGGIDFVTSAGAVQFSFAPPYLVDSSNTTAGSSTAATLHLSQVGSAITVSVSADPTWLADPARVWPIVLDPQVTLAPAGDCYFVNGPYAGTTYCANTSLRVGYDGTYLYRSILQFDLSAIPSDATVTDANLQLYLSFSTGSGNSTLNAKRLKETWSGTATTWNNRDAVNAWTNAGGTVDDTIQGSQTATVGGTGWTSWEIVPLAQGWVNGTYPNDGVRLNESLETLGNVYVFNSDRTTNAPSLKVSWHHWMGELPYWTYVSHRLTDRSDLAVNVANGNVTVHSRDLTIAGTGLPLSLDRYFNSDKIHALDSGYGWNLSLGLGFNVFSSGAGVTLSGPSGYEVIFNLKNSGYTAPPGLEADLVQNLDQSFTLTWHATGTKDNFATPGPAHFLFLTSVVDKNGNTISLAYNTNGVSTITDTQGRVVTFTYGTFNGRSFITKITDSTGRFVQYNYSTDGNHFLTDYYDAANNHTQYVYSGNSLTQIIDPLGNKTDFVWTGCGNGGGVCSIRLVTGASGGQDTGPTYQFAYTNGSTPNTVVTDPNSHTTTYYYDKFGRVTKITDAQSNAQQFTWTSDNHVATQTDAYNHTTTNSYSTDGHNNLTSIQIPTGATTSWAYTDTNHPFYPTSVTDAQTHVTSYTYDTNGNVHTITDSLTSQNSSTINHNSNGTVSSAVDFNGNTTSYTYDTVGNLTKITPPSPSMSSPGAPLGPTTITPDSLSRPGTIQDGKLQNTVYTFDALDRTHVTTYSDGSVITNTFDLDGDLTSLADNTGTTNYSYDALNRKTMKVLPGGGTPTCPTTNALVVCYTYDSASNLLSIQDGGGTVSYAYNSLNELTTLTEPPINGVSPQTTFGYDNNHNRTTTTFPGSTVQTLILDNSQRVSTITAVNGATTLNSLTYSYQNGSNDTALVHSVVRSDSSNDNSTTTNTYDVLNRLTTWAVTVPTGSALLAHTYTYAYDGSSNRTLIVADAITSTLSYNAANELTQIVTSLGTAKYFWDAAGNELGNDGRGNPSKAQTITYNAKNQLSSITDTAQNVIPMTYTGPGQAERVSAGWNSANSDTPWGSNSYTYGSGMLSQTNSAGVDQPGTIRYTYTPDGTPMSQRVPGAASNYYYLLSADGSVLRMVDNAGTVLGTYVYCPTGNAPGDITMTTIALNNPIRYMGMIYDAGSKMDLFGGEYCDSNSGICIQLPCLGIFGVLFNCSPFGATSPIQTQTQTYLDCPPSSGRGPAAQIINGFAIVIRSPESGDFGCHVNAAAVIAGTSIGPANWHIYYNGTQFWGEKTNAANAVVGGLPGMSVGGIVGGVLSDLAATVESPDSTDVLAWNELIPLLTGNVLSLIQYPPSG